jgi:hypothetical protein
VAKRPLSLLLASLTFLYFPAELLARYLSGFTIAPLEGLISGVFPVLLLFALLRVTRLGWFTLVAFIALWGIKDLTLVASARGAGPFELVGHLAVYCISLGYFINPRIRTLYFDPKLCWWKSKPRYETNLPLILKHNEHWSYPIAKNVSDGGCFIETPHLLEMDTEVTLSIPLPVPLAVSVIQTQGQVRWVSKNPLRHGMGIQFHSAGPEHARAIAQYVNEQL